MKLNPVEIEAFESMVNTSGPFQGEPRWAPAFVENFLALSALPELPDDEAVLYKVTDEDSENFPEVAGIREVLLLRTKTGDIWTSVLEPRFPRVEVRLGL